MKKIYTNFFSMHILLGNFFFSFVHSKIYLSGFTTFGKFFKFKSPLTNTCYHVPTSYQPFSACQPSRPEFLSFPLIPPTELNGGLW